MDCGESPFYNRFAMRMKYKIYKCIGNNYVVFLCDSSLTQWQISVFTIGLCISMHMLDASLSLRMIMKDSAALRNCENYPVQWLARVSLCRISMNDPTALRC
jgi:hypothetical protein